ncbi:N-formylglutamate amidohydrolase [Komagataeibacter europaeus]|uniref:N-formylglutamate amidohydrolase n=1 Tax=Komagataeibacter europaeus TaxID=33995 RepID=A0A0M0EGH6_KOMEU|nr:N-formylglutamate deformylase [Komagataeibacter europaeus]KON64367.1 N-formylglutamate amidohydrolase [Komagataeibacter europaeus]GBQ41111.1 N-formylglutamate amidohydrolase [Komagataeibacter europaeus LMG 18890]
MTNLPSGSPVFDFHPGHAPVLLTLPHSGTDLPPGMAARMTPYGRQLPDTDWYIDQLYTGPACERGIGVIRARYSRYVVDLNRGADDAVLYPGRPSTGLVPNLAFDGTPIYQAGQEPDQNEIHDRTTAFWKPYHDAVGQELERLKQQHGWAVLWDGHSIQTHIPRLFEGRLPDLNIGTNSGASCDRRLQDRIAAHAKSLSGYTHVVNGRFRGGYTTRHYGQPDRGFHAVQMEIAQSTYLQHEDAPWPLDETAFRRLSTTMAGFLDTVLDWTPQVR